MPAPSSPQSSARRSPSRVDASDLLAAVLETLPPSAIVRRDGTILRANRAWPQASADRPLRLDEWIPESTARRLLAAGEPVTLPDPDPPAADAARASWSARPFPAADGTTLLLVSRGGSAREQALEDHVVDQQWFETAAALASGLAHDFNNVLAAILGLSEIISLRLPPQSPLQEFSRKIGDSVDRAKQMVRRFSQFSRQSSGITEPQPTAMLLAELVKLLEGFLPGSITFATAIDSNTPWCLVERQALEQIVINCANFLRTRLREANGHVTLAACARGSDHVEIRLRGSGQGLRGVDVESHFALSLGPVPSAYESGTGLFVARTLAGRHDGTLVVEREDPRTVSFVLTLPRAS